MKIFRALSVALIAVLAVFVAVPANAAQAKPDVIVKVYHQPVTPTAVIGSGLGTVRTFFAPIAVNGTSADDQYITGTLTTVAQGVADGLEVRTSNLAFVIGGEQNQLVVGGVSLYAPAGATIAAGARTIRPIIGGSGKYEGATGEVVSTNLGANGWTHVFRVFLPK